MVCNDVCVSQGVRLLLPLPRRVVQTSFVVQCLFLASSATPRIACPANVARVSGMCYLSWEDRTSLSQRRIFSASAHIDHM